MEKNARTWGENEAPLWRWIVATVLALLTGSILAYLFGKWAARIPFFREGGALDFDGALVEGIASFAGFFVSFAVFLRLICKTRIISFFFGSGRKIDIRRMLCIGAAMFIGLVVSAFLSIPNVAYDHPSFGTVIVNALICLCILWLQTSTEEIFFRGLFLRVPFKNEIPPFKKGLIAAVISSLLFMSAHLYNPEVTTQSGAEVILTASTYFISGFAMYIANLLSGGMEACLIMHFVNNFFCFVFVRAQVTVMTTPTLFVDNTTEHLGLIQFFATIISYMAPVLYLLIRNRKMQQSGKA